MTALPAASAFTGTAITESDFKTAIADQRAFLAGLLGTDGLTASALAALGASLNSTVSKSTAYTVVAADRGKILDCTGTWTLSLGASATLGDGFQIAVVNSGSGVVTVDPNGSETVNGFTTQAIAGGVAATFVCNGGAWRSIPSAVISHGVSTFLTSGSWTCPAGVTAAWITAFGGGGGGGRGDPDNGFGGPGIYGAFAIKKLVTTVPGNTYTVTIGAGGAGGSAGTAGNGGSGGTTSFGALASVAGGSGGVSAGGGFDGLFAGLGFAPATAWGGSAPANSGSGGAGGVINISQNGGAGGSGFLSVEW